MEKRGAAAAERRRRSGTINLHARLARRSLGDGETPAPAPSPRGLDAGEHLMDVRCDGDRGEGGSQRQPTHPLTGKEGVLLS